MRISGIETIACGIPFREDYVTARGRFGHREVLLLRIHTDEGVEGLGEAVPLSLRGGHTMRRVDRALRRTFRRLRRLDPDGLVAPDPLAEAVDAYVHVAAGRRLPPPAGAALEMAIFDLAAKVNRMPLWKLLRGEAAAPIPVNATLRADEPAAVAAAALPWAERGFETFKLKIGTGMDVAQVEAVREAIGSRARIRVDANGVLDTPDAIRLLEALEPLGVELAEQPVESLRGLAQVRAASPIPIAGDESIASRKDASKAVQAEACQFATAKLSKVGGMGAAGAIARELPTYLSSALDGPVGIAAAGHTALAIYRGAEDPGLAHGLATQLLFSETLALRESTIEDGMLHLPEGDGLGVELDEAALERHSL
jgi:L-alanine-DL-glutamate epimerase-like enolase superfamily enzyme